MAAGWLVFSGSESREVVLILLAGGSVLVAASSFGAEFNHRTFIQLLVQPVDRRRIWFEKMLVLGAALAPVVLVLLLDRLGFGRGGPFKGLLCVVPLCAFCATPFLTLLFRSAIAGVVFSLAIPLLIWLGGGALVIALIKLGVLQEAPGGAIFDDVLLFRFLTGYFVLAFVGYCGGFYWLGYRKFRNLEVLDGPAAGNGLGVFLERPFQRLLHACLPERSGPFTALLRKELKLQQPTFLVCAAFVLVEAMVVSYLRLFQPSLGDVYFMLPMILYCGFVPLTVGAIAVAEERNFGVLAWHLTLPISARAQWRIKMLVSLGVSLILGVVVPCAVIGIGHALYPPLPALGSMEFWPSFFICLAEALATALALYASSLSNNSLQAIILGAGLALGLGVVADLTVKGGAWLGPVLASALGLNDHYSYGWSLALGHEEPFALMALGLGMVMVLATLLGCAFGNYRRSELDRRALWRHAGVVLIPGVCFVWATTAFLETVYWRFK